MSDFTANPALLGNVQGVVVHARKLVLFCSQFTSRKVTKTDGKFEATEVYFDKRFENHHGGLVLVDGYLYGEGSGKLTCINFKTGVIAWSEPKTSKGSITYADGHLYCRSEGGKGTMTLVEANPKKYVETGRFDQPERSTGKNSQAWAHPVVANGRLYIRDQETLLCFNIKQK